VTYTVAVTSLHSFANPVALAVGGTPTDTTVSWAANPLTPTADTILTITPSLSSPTGTFTLVITGIGGGLTHTTPLTLTINSPSPLFEGVLLVDGDDDYAVSSDSQDLDIGDVASENLTMEAWFNIAELNPSEELYKVIACKWESYCLAIQQRPNQPITIIFHVWVDPYSCVWHMDARSLTAGWHHIDAIFDNPGDALRLYYDGELQSNLTHSILTNNLDNSTYGVEVGGTSVGDYDYLDGMIEEVRLSDIVRYSGDTYSVPSSPFGCDANTRALWHFNQAAGSTIFYDGGDAAGSGCGSTEDTLTGMNGAITGPGP
jgi:hypothetical protein